MSESETGQPSQSSTCSTLSAAVEDDHPSKSKPSDAISVATSESANTTTEKLHLTLPGIFRRRCSHTSSLSSSSNHAIDLEKIKRLYTLAVDEVNYAEDSRGSAYYQGDLISAREAIDDCINAFMELIQETTDPSLQASVRATIAHKMTELQNRYDALPKPDDNGS
ncbi:uncharacterized protein BYT42DRAFT_617890 [Radiomyces spectabilis]|uniref:uncharacterized protein n=1 Tax=Radiomyces spectabilis TaxID=64574 RepID=UPI00221FE08F|nr:uncharacterized protein BYT42DRAFT_617890 [Radiomyces spectabilis]KAI8367462.1 hypothetical protein BYT42DRAFT_617890 [Radiomyces spectabilis]